MEFSHRCFCKIFDIILKYNVIWKYIAIDDVLSKQQIYICVYKYIYIVFLFINAHD